MHKTNRITATILTLFSLLLIIPAMSFGQVNPRKLVDESLAAMKRVRTLSGELISRERYKGKMGAESHVIFTVVESPKTIDIEVLKPEDDAGTKIHWKAGENKGKAKVEPSGGIGSLLDPNLKPDSDLLVGEQHHTILTLGLKFTHDIIQHSLNKYGEDFDEYVSYGGSGTWHGRNVHFITIEFSDWKWESYTMEKTETLLDLEKRLKLNAFLIGAKNGYAVNQKIKAGKVLQVPNAYAKSTKIFVDKVTKLPIRQEMADEKGVFEWYDYRKLKVN